MIWRLIKTCWATTVLTCCLSVPAQANLPMESASASNSYEVRLKHRKFTPKANIGSGASAAYQIANKQRFLLAQFSTLPTSQQLKKLKIKPLHYVSGNTLLLAIPPTIDPATLPGLRWIGTLATADKLSTRAANTLKKSNSNASVTLLVEGFPTDDTNLSEILWNLGATVEPYSSLPDHVKLVSANKSIFSTIAEQNEIAWISQPNAKLLLRAPVRYCPGPATAYGTVANFNAPSIGWDGPGQQSTQLSYHFLNDTAKITGTDEYVAIQRAMQEWSKYVNVTFSQTTKARQRRSIDLLWAAGAHGDGVDFDGPGQTLAHAFFPAPDNRETIAGDLHFDGDESWAIYSSTSPWDNAKTDIYTVALHEIGHSLGLAHSDASWAVMAPFYAGPISNLQSDDVLGIRAIYSATAAAAPAPPGCTPNFTFNAFDPTLPLIALGCSFGLFRRRK